MNAFYLTYKEKTNSEIDKVLDNCSHLSLKAKLGLRKLINEESSNFDYEKTEALEKAIAEDLADIKSLKYLKWLGIDFYENADGHSIKKSDTSTSRDIQGLIVSTVMSLAFFVSLIYWNRLISDGIAILPLVLAIALTSLGINGFVSFIRFIDRFYFYKDLLISKENNQVYLRFRTKNILVEKTLPPEPGLALTQDNNSIILYAIDGAEEIEIKRYKNLNYTLTETLKSMVEKFNS